MRPVFSLQKTTTTTTKTLLIVTEKNRILVLNLSLYMGPQPALAHSWASVCLYVTQGCFTVSEAPSPLIFCDSHWSQRTAFPTGAWAGLCHSSSRRPHSGALYSTTNKPLVRWGQEDSQCSAFVWWWWEVTVILRHPRSALVGKWSSGQ